LRAEAEAVYGRWAPVYDLLFDLPFHAGRLAAARAAGEATPDHGELLVVGVGTGLELSLLPRNVRVIGIDLSAPMLEVARKRVRRRGLEHVKALIKMDAAAMSFEMQRFDTALAPYVLSVVPDPQRTLDEMWRVLKPGGEMIVMNHFSAERGLRAAIETRLERSAAWLGWHPVFPLSVVGDWAAELSDLDRIERRDIGLLRLFTLLSLRKLA
jgi:phosphatidylethanolamine/phosphatidyl-N-methylethanolamine N-methyltransferase